ncbi:hypothetical protein N7535_002322 [Penicillium sp. DV-2018c]|nr:hypothetical protein N7461_004437 [Penicillium sp. DV-2018c]KAJ5583702.1 hypothetical protein N7535_002322 [Penicillium sp. DV-2018c]
MAGASNAVQFVEIDDSRLKMWEEQEKFVLGDYNPSDHQTFETNAAVISGKIVMSYEPDPSCGMYDNMVKAYNSSLGSKRARVKSAEEEPDKGSTTEPARAKRSKQRRTPQALIGPSISIKELLNSLEITMSLTQLIDISPQARTEISKLLELNPVEKTRKPAKRARTGQNQVLLVNQVGEGSEPERNNERHDDMMQPAEESSTILFFTCADVFAMAKDNVTTGAKLTKVLIDGGSTGNMIPRHVVDKLRCRTVPVSNISMETADGSRVQMATLVWITVVLAGTTRVIAAIVVDGARPPSYSLLLGKHWMKNVDLIGNYGKEEYTIRNDDRQRVPVPRTGLAARVPIPTVPSKKRWDVRPM